MPDGCGQGEDALSDAGADSGHGSAAVLFQIELAFERVVDRFDDLAQWLEQMMLSAGRFAFAVRAQQGDAGLGEFGFKNLPVVVLVGDDRGGRA